MTFRSCLYHAGMASADVQRRLLRTGQGVLTPAEGLAALRWVLQTNGLGADPQVTCQTTRRTVVEVAKPLAIHISHMPVANSPLSIPNACDSHFISQPCLMFPIVSSAVADTWDLVTRRLR